MKRRFGDNQRHLPVRPSPFIHNSILPASCVVRPIGSCQVVFEIAKDLFVLLNHDVSLLRDEDRSLCFVADPIPATRLVHRVLIGSDIGTTGVWRLPDCVYGSSPVSAASACQPSVNLKTMTSSELLSALKTWKNLGVKIFDGRDPVTLSRPLCGREVSGLTQRVG